MSWNGKGSANDPGWTCQCCGQGGNWQTKTHCRRCFEPHPLVAQKVMAYGQGGKGKGKKGVNMVYSMTPAMHAKGKYTQGMQEKGGHPIEDADYQ
eukprot:8761366-Heterocapsa_arctica.AAC.1